MATKICAGPVHGGKRIRLPLTDEYWYFRKTDTGRQRKGTPYYICRLCHSYEYSMRRTGVVGGLIDSAPIRVFLDELVLRCGSPEATARRIGISHKTVTKIIQGQKRVRRATAGLIIKALDQQRREDRRNHRTHEDYRLSQQKKAILHGQTTSKIHHLT